jgi:hypothetical protein
MIKKKVIKHLRGDIKTFKHEAADDKALIKDLHKKRWESADMEEVKRPMKKRKKKGTGKIETVMHEFKEHGLRSGSKKGPKVTDRKQAVAIALSSARKAGARIPKKK